MKRACVVDVYTSTYWYVPVCTSMYLRYLNFEFFEIRPHPSILVSLALELCAVAVYSLRAARVPVYEKHSCLVNCQYIPVRTGTYRYVPFCLILSDLSRGTGFQMVSPTHHDGLFILKSHLN